MAWLTSNHMLGSGNFWEKSPSWSLKILKLPSYYSHNFKSFKNPLGQFIPNRHRKHVVTSTNWYSYLNTLSNYFIAVLDVSTLFSVLLKNQIFGKFVFEMTSGGWKMYVKRTKGEGVLLKRTKAYKGREQSKIARF